MTVLPSYMLEATERLFGSQRYDREGNRLGSVTVRSLRGVQLCAVNQSSVSMRVEYLHTVEPE
jgi:hypothetical protein